MTAKLIFRDHSLYSQVLLYLNHSKEIYQKNVLRSKKEIIIDSIKCHLNVLSGYVMMGYFSKKKNHTQNNNAYE